MHFQRAAQQGTGIVCPRLLSLPQKDFNTRLQRRVFLFRGKKVFCTMIRALLFYRAALSWLENHLLSCPSKKWLHLECPGCGLQRGCLALLRGDLAGTLEVYPATPLIFILLGFTVLHLKYRFRYGGEIIKYLYLITSFVIIVFYMYKIYHHKITA
jgi:hypothetical protein